MSANRGSRESGSRDMFLTKLAQRSREVTTPHLIDAAGGGDGADGISYTADLSNLTAAFTSAAVEQGSTVYVVRSDADHVAAVLEIATDSAIAEFVVSNESPAEEFGEVLRQAGASIRTLDDARDLTQDDTVVTGAAAGIALTGSIALASGSRGSRLVTTLPMTHVALLDAATIVPTPREVYRSFAAGTWPGSSLTVATGPSRSSDIERIITLGVHGPGRVIIVVDARI